MGRGYGCTCSKCGFHIECNFGVGFLFPKVYAETIDKAKNGEFGTKYQSFFLENKDVALDCENVMLQCKDCGQYDEGMDLSAYMKKPEYQIKKAGIWSASFPFEGASYETDRELKEGYIKKMDFPHKCKKCKGAMRIISGEEFNMFLDNQEITCPKCKIPLELTDIISWD